MKISLATLNDEISYHLADFGKTQSNPSLNRAFNHKLINKIEINLILKSEAEYLTPPSRAQKSNVL